MRKRILLAVAVLTPWAFSTLWGMKSLAAFDHTPGASGAAPANWPGGSAIHGKAGRPNLVVFLHPRCSCSTATLHELAQLRTLHAMNGPAVTFLFEGPSGGENETGPLRQLAGQFSGAQVIRDRDGTEGRLFGALTSGHTLLYDARGKLLFSGGVTGARGHEGDNYGIDRLEALLASPGGAPGISHQGPTSTPVFGCDLQ